MLTLFDSVQANSAQERPDELTPFDRAWLERLYAGIPNLPASTRLHGVEVAENE